MKAKKSASAAGNAWAFDFSPMSLLVSGFCSQAQCNPRIRIRGPRRSRGVPGPGEPSRSTFSFKIRCHFFWKNVIFAGKKRRRQATCRKTGAGRRQDSKIRPCRVFGREKAPLRGKPLAGQQGLGEAAGRPKSGGAKKCSRSLRGLPLSPPVPLVGPLGPPRAQKQFRGPHKALGAPWGPCGALGALWAHVGPPWAPTALRDLREAHCTLVSSTRQRR